MHVSRYRPVVYLQFFLLFIDLAVNTAAALLGKSNVVLLVVFVIQDVCLILSLIVLFLMFFNTFVFQAGLIFLLVRKFKATIITIIFYFIVSVILHIVTLKRKWGVEMKYVWTDPLQALFAIQRLMSVGYYFTYKRAIVKLAHPQYYRDTEWLRKEFR